MSIFRPGENKMAFYGEFFVHCHVTVLSLRKFQNSSRISVYPSWRELKTKQNNLVSVFEMTNS